MHWGYCLVNTWNLIFQCFSLFLYLEIDFVIDFCVLDVLSLASHSNLIHHYFNNFCQPMEIYLLILIKIKLEFLTCHWNHIDFLTKISCHQPFEQSLLVGLFLLWLELIVIFIWRINIFIDVLFSPVFSYLGLCYNFVMVMLYFMNSINFG